MAFELGYVISNPSSAVFGDWGSRPSSATNWLSGLESHIISNRQSFFTANPR